MFHPDNPTGAERPEQELSNEELSQVLGGAAPQLATSAGRTFVIRATPAQEALELFRERLPVINPERIRPGLANLAEIHPDLEDPFPKDPKDPQDPPIPPDLEDPFPPRPPAELFSFRR